MISSVQTLILSAVGVILSLIITFIFNGIVNLPKKKKQREEEELKKETSRQKELEVLTQNIEEVNKSIKAINIEILSRQDKDNKITDDLELIKAGLQSVIKNELKIRYEYWVHEKYAPNDAKEDLERMYQTYHKLGANGVMDTLRKKFMSLPDELFKE